MQHLAEQLQQGGALADGEAAEDGLFNFADAGQQAVCHGLTLVGDLHKHAATVVGVRHSPHQASVFELVERACHRGGGHQHSFADVARREWHRRAIDDGETVQYGLRHVKGCEHAPFDLLYQCGPGADERGVDRRLLRVTVGVFVGKVDADSYDAQRGWRGRTGARLT